MKISRTIVAIILTVSMFFIWNENVFSAPANEVFRTVTQPDGTTFKAKPVGNEFKHWYETKDGHIILRGDDDYWVYGKIEDSNLTATSSKVGIDKLPNDVADRDEMAELPSQTEGKPKMMSPSVHKSTLQSLKGSTHDLVVLLVSFKDERIAHSESEWNDKIFNRSANSLNNYYDEVSSGQFGFNPADETSGQNNGVVSVTLDYNHPDPVGKPTRDDLFIKIAKDAIVASDSMVNYKDYDKDNSKYITSDELHIVTVIAGGEASYGDTTNAVWGHKSGMITDVPKIDNVYVGSLYKGGGYTQFGENHGDHMATIGIIAHELGHDLGLPDLYDRDQSSLGIGIHSLMAGGSWTEKTGEHSGATPTHLDAWSKIQLGFVDPEVITKSSNINLNSIENGGYNVIKINTENPWEYFLIENRQYTGYDKGLENATVSGGVAVWHIDEGVRTYNDNEAHKYVDLEEANEAEEGSDLDNDRWYKDFNHYYRKGFKTLLNSNTKPNTHLNDGTPTDLWIEIMDYSQDEMKGKVVFGNEDLDEPIWQSGANVTSTNITADSVSLSWSPASDASGIENYEVYLGDELIKTVSSNTRTTEILDLQANKYYRFKVEAVDKKGNRTTDGPFVTVKTKLESIVRLKGKDRFETANEISKQTYNSAKTVIIATGYDFPDALAGGPLAKKLEAPILLAGKTSLSVGTVKEIQRLSATEAIILGGTGAVSESVSAQLKELGLKLDRIKGKDRFETAANIAEELKPYDQAVLAYGMNFPDALAIAPYAAQKGYPILLTNTKTLANPTKIALENVEKTYVVGGTGVISTNVANNLPDPTRYSGKNRFATNANIVSRLYSDYEKVYYASGMNFPDALTGSVAAAQSDAPKFLVTKDAIPKEINTLINQRKASSYVILGGSGAISDKVEQQLSK